MPTTTETTADVEAIGREITQLKSTGFRGCMEIHFAGNGEVGSVKLISASKSIDQLVRERVLDKLKI